MEEKLCLGPFLQFSGEDTWRIQNLGDSGRSQKSDLWTYVRGTAEKEARQVRVADPRQTHAAGQRLQGASTALQPGQEHSLWSGLLTFVSNGKQVDVYINENAGINSFMVKGGLSTKELANAVTTTQAEKEVENPAAQKDQCCLLECRKATILSCVFFRRGFISTQQWTSRNPVTAVMTKAWMETWSLFTTSTGTPLSETSRCPRSTFSSPKIKNISCAISSSNLFLAPLPRDPPGTLFITLLHLIFSAYRRTLCSSSIKVAQCTAGKLNRWDVALQLNPLAAHVKTRFSLEKSTQRIIFLSRLAPP